MVLAQDLLEAERVLYRVSYLQRVVWPRGKAGVTLSSGRTELREAGLGGTKEHTVRGAWGAGEPCKGHLVNGLGGEEAVLRAGVRSQRRQDNIDAPT